MPQFINQSKIDFAFKYALSVFGTNPTWNWFAELYKNEVNVLLGRIWADPLAFAVNFAEADANAIAYSQITKTESVLTLEPSHNNRLWRARAIPGDVTSDVIVDSISPLDVPDSSGQPSIGYTVRLYQDNGSGGLGPEVSTTSGAWIWHYKICALLLDESHTAEEEGWTQPLHIVFYQYTGAFGGSSGPNTYISPQGILYFQDSTRGGKKLSGDRSTINFGINHTKAQGKRYLTTVNEISSERSSYLVPRDATLTSISAHSANTVTGTIQIEKLVAGSPTGIYSIILTAESEKLMDNLNIDLDAGDQVRAFIDTGLFDYPSIQFELAWRF